MGASQPDAHVVGLYSQILHALESKTTLMGERMTLDYDDPREIIIQSEIDKLNDQIDGLFGQINELERLAKLYQRPQGFLARPFSSVLGPLPADMDRIDSRTDSSQEVIKSLPSYRLKALSALVMVVLLAAGLSYAIPALLISPLSLFMTTISVGQETQSSIMLGVLLVVCILTGILAIFKRKSFGGLIFQAALDEEMWFRSGAEKWSVRQRLVSCLSFGACHVLNLIYPLVMLLALSLVGAAFMAAYLAEYRRSQDVERATLASAKLHAVYNNYALTFIVSAISLVIGIYLFI